MPAGPTLTATATVTGTETFPQATATVTVATTYPDATLSLDTSVMGPWLSNDRFTSVEVTVNDYPMTGLVGTVDISEGEGSPIQELSFNIVDTRGTYWAADSVLYGGQAVKVWCTSGTNAGRSRLQMFEGKIEAASNDDAYCPRAAIRASSLSRTWGDRGTNMGRLSVPAFGGYTWGDLIQLYATSSCTPLTTYYGDLTDEVYSSFDISGVSLVDLIQQWAPLIGVYLRERDGTLDLVPERFVVGELATPQYAFTPANYLSVREELPSRPITALTLTAVIPDVKSLGKEYLDPPQVSIVRGTNDDGSEYETTTKAWWEIRYTHYAGVLASAYYALQIVEEDTFSNAFPGGVADSGSYPWQRHSFARTTTYYSTVDIDVPAPRYGEPDRTETRRVATQQKLLVERDLGQLYSPLCAVAYGSGFAWTDGSHHINQYPQWYGALPQTVTQPFDRTTTEYTYTTSAALGGTCKLTESTMVRSAYGSKLDPNGEQWDDGTYRSGYNGADYEEFDEVERQVETWEDNADDPQREAAYTTLHTLQHYAFVQVGSDVVSSEIRPEEAYRPDHYESEYRVAINSDSYMETTVSGNVTKSGVVKGAIPDNPTSSTTIPNYSENAVVITGASMRNIYPLSRASETTQDAQRIEEMYRYIRRKLRDQLAVKYVVSHPMVPYLRTFDAVTLTDPARGIDEIKGYVTAIRRTADLAGGWLGQETTIAVTPEEIDPVWP